jgi:CBS-domain-containing membrane protein
MGRRLEKLRLTGAGFGFESGLLDPNVVSRAPNYLFQCGLATATLIIILLVQDTVLQAAIVVAVASTAFTIFVVPHSVASTPRRVIGGHVVAVLTGSMFSSILLIPGLESASAQSRYLLDIMAALSVGLAILVMVATNTEHPPAAGTALGLVVQDWSWSSVEFILVSAIALSLIRLALRPKLMNLF